MHAEIIAIGDEITSGQLLDTNTQWLAQRLEELGVRVLYHSTVGDDLAAMTDVVRLAFKRSNIVIMTGGLGPTADDLTREAIAKAVDRPLEFHEEAMEHIRALFARRKYEMPERNRVQAMFPVGSLVIPNPNGTAPGVDYCNGEPVDSEAFARLFALPGVPAEMRDMWYGYVERGVRESGGGKTIVRHRRVKCFGAGESKIEEMLPDMIRRGRDPRVGINASGATIILRVTAEGATEEACEAKMAPTLRTIHETLGDLVYGEDDDELQDAVASLLRQTNRTLAVVEWGTGGQINDLLSATPAAEGRYLGGFVVRDTETLRRYRQLGAVAIPLDSPEQIVVEMAGLPGLNPSGGPFDTPDYTLAVGPFPKPPAEGEDSPPMHFALAGPGGVECVTFPFGSHPALLKIVAVKRGLNLVRKALLAELA